MRFVAGFIFALGVIHLLAGLVTMPAGAGRLIEGVCWLIIGTWTTRAANSFRLIVDTEENDIRNLMTALGELKKLYTLQYVIVIAAIVMIVLALLVGMFGPSVGGS